MCRVSLHIFTECPHSYSVTNFCSHPPMPTTSSPGVVRQEAVLMSIERILTSLHERGIHDWAIRTISDTCCKTCKAKNVKAEKDDGELKKEDGKDSPLPKTSDLDSK